MAKRRLSKKSSAGLSPLARRITHLWQEVWNGNKLKMARDLGLTHSVLWRVLQGLQEPPAKLLDALAHWLGINIRWLFLGEGEPLSNRNLWAGGGSFLPIARELLPGATADYPELLNLTSFPVAEALNSVTAYWFELTGDHALVKDKAAKELKLKAGDYLLLETSPPWTRKVEAVRRRLCAFRLRRSYGYEVVLGLVGENEEYFEDYFPVEMFGRFEQGRFYPVSDGTDEVIEPGVVVVDLRFPNIVGVCIKMDRVL